MIALTHIGDPVELLIESILRSSFRLRHCGVIATRRRQVPILTESELQWCRRLYPRLSSISGRAVVPFANLHSSVQRIRHYVFLREPIHRCALEFVRQRRSCSQRTNFEDWIRDPHNRNRQSTQLCGRPDGHAAIETLQNRLSFVGLAGRLHESLVMFARWSEEPQIDIRYRQPLRNANAAREAQRMIADFSTQRMLADANRQDAMLYDYAVNSVFPRQVKAYGATLPADVQTYEAFNLPRSRFPREMASILWREMIYRPLAPWIASCQNSVAVTEATHSQSATDGHRRAA